MVFDSEKEKVKVFSTREMATMIWVLILLPFILNKKENRKALLNVIRAFKLKLIISILVLIGYVTCIILILYKCKFWDSSMIKDTIFWIIFTGIGISFKYDSKLSIREFFYESFKDNIRIMLIFEFLFSTYTFSILIELLLLPLSTFIIGIKTISERDEKLKPVNKLMMSVEVLLGLVITIFTLKNIVNNIDTITSVINLKNFILPIILGVSLLPYIYLFAVYMGYETLFFRLYIGSEKSKYIIKKAKMVLLVNCKLNLFKINKACSMGLYNLMAVETDEDIENMKKIYKENL